MAAPVLSNQRIQYLDIVRGVAISGVLFAQAFWNLGTEPVSSWTGFDKTLDEAGTFLIDSKCYTLLATLFTVGFVLHMNKSQDLVGNLRTYRKRLLGLLILGWIHALTVRNGDILAPYAILSLIATLFYRASNRVIVSAIILVFMLEVLMPHAFRWANLPIPSRPSGSENYLADNFQWVMFWYKTSIFYWERTLMLLLGGLLVGRYFIQKKKSLSNRQVWITGFCALAVGSLSYLAINLYASGLSWLPKFATAPVFRSFLFQFLQLLHQAGMAAGYASFIFLLMQKVSMRLFANLGRLSLTNYLSQATLITPFCILFNQFDHITPTKALVMTVVVWVLQVLFTNWWLKRKEFGPMEWLLRRFTYGKSLTRETNKEPGISGAVAMN